MKQLQEKLLKGKDDKTQWKDQNEKMLAMRDQVFEANSVIKQNKITITNDKGRLTEEQIEKMIKEAEQRDDEGDWTRI